MKKILTLIILTATLSLAGYSQLPEADVRVENPRIIGSQLYFDIYFQKTNDAAGWNLFGFDVLNASSWYFYANIADLTNWTIVYESPILFPPGSPGNYTNTTGTTTLGPNTYFWINTAFTTNQFIFIDLALNTWYLAFTVRADISGTVTNLSGLSWDQVNTGLTGGGSSTSVFPIGYYDSGCDIALNTKTWTGANTINANDWNDALNWSPNGIPTSSDDIIYPFDNGVGGLVPSIPIMSGFNSVPYYGVVNNLRVNHFATLTIPQNRGLTVTGNIDLKGGTNIVLAAGTGSGTLSSALIPEGTITTDSYIEDGHIEVHRTLYYGVTTAGFYQHQVAAPVNGVILDDWDMIHEYSYAFEFQNDNQAWWNIYDPTRSTPVGYGFVLSLYEQSGATTQDVVFTDGLELGAVSPAINIDAGEVALIGNPYTAPIDWDVVYAANTNLNGTNRVWNPTGSYVTYVQGTGGNSSARYVQPGQSFFIEAQGGSIASFNIPTTARTQNIVAYLKDDFPNLLRIYTEGSTTMDEQYIRFKEAEGVTGGYDEMHDALAWASNYGDIATEIYTVGTDNSNLSVDARPMIEDEQIDIPLHFKAEREDTYGIFADEESVQSFAPSIKIFLEDTFFPSQQWTDLKVDGYTFTATPEDDYSRFILHFYDSEFGVEELGYQPIKIFSDRSDAIVVNESEQLIKEIHVYDITGNLMLSKSQVNATITRMHISENTGYYVVKVITDKAVYSEKVLITK